jgi:chromosome segregation ATPase
VKNIGGITESKINFKPGVNVLVGRNATNRTSHLQALMAALGKDNVSIKSDAEYAKTELIIGEKCYIREFERQNGSVQSSGEPLLEDLELADLFAFLLKSNEARQAVTQRGNLRELIMRPVDTDAIDQEIERTVSRREEIDAELEGLDALENSLPSLQERYKQYQNGLEEQREKREKLKQRIVAADTDLEESKEEQAELEQRLTELQELRSDLEDIRYRIETEKDSIESLQTEKAEFEDELDSLSLSVRDISDLGEKINHFQERKERLDSTIGKVRNTIQFNREMMDNRADIYEFLDRPTTTNDSNLPTDQLLREEQQNLICWTCGSNVTNSDISSMLADLQDISEEMMEIRRSVKSELENCRQEKKDIEAGQNRRDQIENKLEQIGQELSNRRETLTDLEMERETLKEEIETLETDIDNARDSNYDEVLDLHKQANEVEFEIERLEKLASETEEEMEDIESKLSKYDDIQEKRQELSDRLTELRTKIDRIEQTAIKCFNDHMDEVLQSLNYENIERIWIERTETKVSKGRRTSVQNTFALHVTRSTDSGTVFSDTVDHLSESEREVTGLVFALSGYLVHEVYDKVPFMLLDSLEAIDTKRITALVEYFEKYADNIVVALLEEDAKGLSDDYNRITDIARQSPPQ